MNVKKRFGVGAVYCVYENSAFLQESIRRVYELVDSVIILVNCRPWNGVPIPDAPLKTISDIHNLFDPDHKIQVVSKYWRSEAEQRNFGNKLLHSMGLPWCLIIDDDEMYNYQELKKVLQSLGSISHRVLLSYQKIYWKSRQYSIRNVGPALPVLCKTDPKDVGFSHARMVEVSGGTWQALPAEQLLCHHLSYVRSDEQMHRKITTFSHAHEHPMLEWYKNIWLRWTPEMVNLHPNPDAPWSFDQAVATDQGVEKIGYCKGSSLETLLRASDFAMTKISDSEFKGNATHAFLNRWASVVDANPVFVQSDFLIRTILEQYGHKSVSLEQASIIYFNKETSPTQFRQVLAREKDLKWVIFDGPVGDSGCYEYLMKYPFLRIHQQKLTLFSIEKLNDNQMVF